MDLCMSYIKEADECINQITPISLFDSVFSEAGDIPDAEKKNGEMQEKSLNFLQKACAVIRSIYQKIRKMIRDFTDFLHLTVNEKDEFKKFEEECRQNPEFANKKITVRDWRAIQNAYSGVINEVEKEIKDISRKEEEARPSFFSAITHKLDQAKGVAKDTAVEMTIAKVLDMCKHSPEFADVVNKGIEFDTNVLGTLEKEIGEARVKGYQKKLKHLSSKHKLVRFLAGSRKKAEEDGEKSIRDMLHDIKMYYDAAKKVQKKNPDAKAAVDAGTGILKDVAKETLSNRKELKREAKAKKKELKKVTKERKRMEKE